MTKISEIAPDGFNGDCVRALKELDGVYAEVFGRKAAPQEF